MADVKQESGVKQIIVTIPVSADDGGGGNVEMTLEDFCKLDIKLQWLISKSKLRATARHQVIIHPM